MENTRVECMKRVRRNFLGPTSPSLRLCLRCGIVDDVNIGTHKYHYGLMVTATDPKILPMAITHLR